jgi:hypothetical protein
VNASASAPAAGPDGAGGDGPERLFTAFVRSLEAGDEPDAELLDRVLRALRGVLRQEMRRRSLMTAPPSFVGVVGWPGWQQPGALEDLAASCYGYVFVDRLRALQAQLRVRDNIDGLVFRNVKNFLHDLQKANDPVGYRAYEVLRSAVESAAAAGGLRVEGEDKLGGDSLCVFPAAAVAAEDRPDTEERTRRRRVMEQLTAQWNAELLPELILARGKQRDEVAAELSRRLPELAAEGVVAFRFRELLAHLRRDLRQRWAALLWQSKGTATAPRQAMERPAADTGGDDAADTGFVRVLHHYRPPQAADNAVAERQAFRRLTDCVSRLVEEHAADRRTRRYLDKLWQFIRTCVTASEPVPSRRKLSRFLDIPRDRLPGLHAVLVDALERCRDEQGAPARGGRSGGPGGEEEP